MNVSKPELVYLKRTNYCQYLLKIVAEDILGDSKGPFPRHSKQYANLHNLRSQMQDIRISAFKEFIKEVKNDKFPSKPYEVNVDESVKKELIKYIEN